jgi:hypothetical protein
MKVLWVLIRVAPLSKFGEACVSKKLQIVVETSLQFACLMSNSPYIYTHVVYLLKNNS